MRKLFLSFFLISQVFAGVTISGIKVLPRQDNALDGNISKHEIYVSSDEKTWGSPVYTGIMSNDKTEKTITFSEKNARFLKLKAITEGNGGKNSAISEINILDSSGKPLDRKNWVITADSSSTNSTYAIAGPVNFAIDGDTNTFWITDWTKAAPLPHEIIIDTGESPVIVDLIPKVSPTFTILWDKNPEPDIVKYIISYGTTTQNYTTNIDSVSNLYTFSNIPPNKRYYLAIIAVNKAGLKSEPSDEYVFDVILKNLPSAPIKPELVNNKRFINIQMSVDGVNYTSIGMVPYPVIKGQKYKTTILTEK